MQSVPSAGKHTTSTKARENRQPVPSDRKRAQVKVRSPRLVQLVLLLMAHWRPFSADSTGSILFPSPEVDGIYPKYAAKTAQTYKQKRNWKFVIW